MMLLSVISKLRSCSCSAASSSLGPDRFSPADAHHTSDVYAASDHDTDSTTDVLDIVDEAWETMESAYSSSITASASGFGLMDSIDRKPTRRVWYRRASRWVALKPTLGKFRESEGDDSTSFG